MVLRFMIFLVIAIGILFGAAYVVTEYMEPPEKEIVSPVPSDKFGH